MAEILACALEVAPIHAEPDAASEQVTQALRGEPLTVEERRDGWVRIRTPYDYPGWIAEAALGGEPMSWPPAEQAGEPLEEARGYLGIPYLWGGMSRHGIDCSGLVHMAHRRLGRIVPRDADQQEAAGEEVAQDELRPGDLVCYEGHIAFWLGEGRILHSTQREGVNGVVEEPEPAELRPRFHRYVRL